MNPYASIKELANGLKSKKFSSLELTQFYLHRLNTIGREYNAVAELTDRLAIEQAKASDRRRSKGTGKGVLDGIPFGVKDLLSAKGIPTRWGSPGHHDQVFNYDATSVAKLQDAGGVLIGKLAMIELAGGGNYNVAGASATGPCLSAFDKKCWAGGSSSGSGSATGLGCVPYSLGSETSGSITCPSAFNGCTGFRGTYGRVSRHGAMALCWTLDKVGPITRSAEDAAIVLKVIAGHDPNDVSTLKERLDLSARGPKPRIGLLKEDFKKNRAKDCEKAYQDAVAVFKKLGYDVVNVTYPDLPYGIAIDLIVNAEGASAHENFIRGERFQMLADVNQVAGFAAALTLPAVDYLWAMRFRQQEAIKANAVWSKCDAIFTPVFYHGAPSIDQPFSKTFELMGGDSGPSNLLGWPALAFPIGFEGKLPLGGQILAPCRQEATCLRIVNDYQKCTNWHRQHPSN